MKGRGREWVGYFKLGSFRYIDLVIICGVWGVKWEMIGFKVGNLVLSWYVIILEC